MSSALAGRRVLITGGLGFIGSNLAHRLVGQGARITLVDSLNPKGGGNRCNIEGLDGELRVEIADIGRRRAIDPLVRDAELIFNLAGLSSHLDSMNDPAADLRTNCAAQLALLESCRKANPEVRVVFASTRQIYGRPDYLPVDEVHPLRPVDVNGIHRLASESYHLLYHAVHGLKATALRLTNTYGPRMRIKDARQTFLGVWIRHRMQGQPFEVWGGEQLRDLSYVDDVVEALLLTALKPETIGQVYNLSGPSVVSLLQLAKRVGGAYEVREFPAERQRIDVGDYYADDSRFRAATGWSPKVDLEEGLARTCDYFRPRLDRYL